MFYKLYSYKISDILHCRRKKSNQPKSINGHDQNDVPVTRPEETNSHPRQIYRAENGDIYAKPCKYSQNPVILEDNPLYNYPISCN